MRSEGIKMTVRFQILTALFISISLLIVQCGSKARSPETLLEERCAECHTLAPIEAARKKRVEWEKTVYRMVHKGARLSNQEAELMIDYLADNYGPE